MVMNAAESSLYLPKYEVEGSAADMRRIPITKDWAPFKSTVRMRPIPKRQHSLAEMLSPLEILANRSVQDSLDCQQDMDENYFSCKETLANWANRFMAIENAMNADVVLPDTTRKTRLNLVRKTWYAPISDEGLCRYWIPDFVSHAMPEPPPLCTMPTRNRVPYKDLGYSRDNFFSPGWNFSFDSTRGEWQPVSPPGFEPFFGQLPLQLPTWDAPTDLRASQNPLQGVDPHQCEGEIPRDNPSLLHLASATSQVSAPATATLSLDDGPAPLTASRINLNTWRFYSRSAPPSTRGPNLMNQNEPKRQETARRRSSRDVQSRPASLRGQRNAIHVHKNPNHQVETEKASVVHD